VAAGDAGVAFAVPVVAASEADVVASVAAAEDELLAEEDELLLADAALIDETACCSVPAVNWKIYAVGTSRSLICSHGMVYPSSLPT